MIRTLTGTWWLLALCGVLDAMLAADALALREELENTSVRREEGSSAALLGGLVSTQGSSLQPERREPEREPDQE